MKLILALCAILFLGNVSSAPNDFPENYLSNGYTAISETVDTLSGVQMIYAKEYFKERSDMGKLEMIMEKSKMDFFFMKNQDQGVLIYYDLNACNVTTIDKSFIVEKHVFWRWVNRFDNKIDIGPLSIFRSLEKSNWPKFVNITQVRGIQAKLYTVEFNSKDEKVKVQFYLSTKATNLPYGKENIPLRLTAKGVYQSNKFDITTDFTLFKGSEPDEADLQIPYGYGCEGFNNMMKIPVFPKEYSYSAKVITTDMTSDKKDISIWSYSTLRMQDPHFNMYQKTSKDENYYQVHDFHTGLIYTTDENGNCKTSALEKDYVDFLPNYIQDLNQSSLYYIGKGYVRNILCDIWERVYNDEQLFHVNKLVITSFYTAKNMEKPDETSEDVQFPLQIIFTGYKRPDDMLYEKNHYQIVNIYEYKEHLTLSHLRHYDVRNCFQKSDQRGYYEFIFPGGEVLARNGIEVAPIFKEKMIQKLGDMGLAPIRIPFLNLRDEGLKIVVQAMILEKANIIDTFNQMRENLRDSDLVVKTDIGKILSKEDCGELCIAEEGCGSFFYCGMDCYMAQKSFKIYDDDIKVTDQICDYYEKGLIEGKLQVSLNRITIDLMKFVKDGNLAFEIESVEDGKMVSYIAKDVFPVGLDYIIHKEAGKQ